MNKAESIELLEEAGEFMGLISSSLSSFSRFEVILFSDTWYETLNTTVLFPTFLFFGKEKHIISTDSKKYGEIKNLPIFLTKKISEYFKNNKILILIPLNSKASNTVQTSKSILKIPFNFEFKNEEFPVFMCNAEIIKKEEQ